MSSPVGYPQGNSLKMFTDGTYGAGDIPVGVPGKNLTPIYATSSDWGVDNRQLLVTRHAAADVLVYGATAAGFAAAYRAAKNGASVVIVNPTSQVGGMPTGGLSNCDVAYGLVTRGVFSVFAQRVYEFAPAE